MPLRTADANNVYSNVCMVLPAVDDVAAHALVCAGNCRVLCTVSCSQ